MYMCLPMLEDDLDADLSTSECKCSCQIKFEETHHWAIAMAIKKNSKKGDEERKQCKFEPKPIFFLYHASHGFINFLSSCQGATCQRHCFFGILPSPDGHHSRRRGTQKVEQRREFQRSAYPRCNITHCTYSPW